MGDALLSATKVERCEDGLAYFYAGPGRAYASITVPDDGQIVGLTTDGAGHIVAWESAFSDEAVHDAAERVATFLASVRAEEPSE